MKNIGEQIRKSRLENKLTLNQLAHRAGIGTMTLQRIESGKTIPNVHVLIKLAQQLDKTINDFIGEPGGFCSLIKAKSIKKIRQAGVNVSILSPKDMGKKGVTVSHLIEKKGTIIGPLKSPNRLVFVYQFKGDVTFEYLSKNYKMKGGDTLYFDGNYEHKVTVEGDTESILISIKQ
jgi:transcriptional regulator with XRE-family HTH domain